jgi:hypothetical protein
MMNLSERFSLRVSAIFFVLFYYFSPAAGFISRSKMDLDELSMLLDCVNVESSTPSEFYAAVVKAVNCGFDQDHKLILYGLFKQGTVGEVPHNPPSEEDKVGYSKW